MTARRRDITIALLYLVLHAAAALAFVLRRDPGTDAAWIGFPLDDSWIHFVYARSLAHGGLFEYVPGRPEAGFTSPLWVLLLTPIFWLTSDPRVAALACKVIGVLVATGCSVLADRLATRLGGARWAGLVAGIAIAVDPSLTFASVSGMEPMLAAGAMLAGLLAWIERRWTLAGIALACALLARPECGVVIALVIGAELWRRRLPRPEGGRAGERGVDLARLAGPTIVSGALWSAFCLVIAGRPLPNTFYAKHHGHSLLETWSDVPRIFGPQLLDQPWFFFGSGFVLLALAARRIVRDRELGPARALVILGGPLAFLVGIAWAHDILWVRAFAVLRYTLPHLPWTIALLAVGAHEAVSVVRAARTDASARARGLALVCVAALLLPLVALPMRFDRSARAYAWNTQNIEEMQVRVALWLHTHTAAGEWVATHDAGAIRVFSERPVLDLAGLNEHRVSTVGAGLFAEVSPRYFVVFPTWFPHMASSPRYRGVFSASASQYTICPCTSTELRVLEPIVRRTVVESEEDLQSHP